MRKTALLLPAILGLAACTARPLPATAPEATEAAARATPTTQAVAARVIDVYKSPTCGCCHEWEAYLRSHGYTIRSIPTEEIVAIKQGYGMPTDAWSCHTAVIGGYFVEGHVPVDAIEDLLSTRPQIDGISLPGMPDGSPGMPGVKAAPFPILSITDGAVSDFGAY